MKNIKANNNYKKISLAKKNNYEKRKHACRRNQRIINLSCNGNNLMVATARFSLGEAIERHDDVGRHIRKPWYLKIRPHSQWQHGTSTLSLHASLHFVSSYVVFVSSNAYIYFILFIFLYETKPKFHFVKKEYI